MNRKPRRYLTLPLLLALCVTTSALFAATPATSTTRPEATTRTATPPASASAPAPTPKDFSTPAATAKTLLTAINHVDFATVRLSLDIPAPPSPHAANIDAILSLMEASGRLQQAASARFLAAGDKAFGTPTAATLAAQLKGLTDVTITGATATITIPTDTTAQLPGGTVELKKIGPDWKIDGAAFFKLNSEPAAKTAERVALAKTLTTITDAVTKEITAGKFFSATEAYQEYWTRCREATQPTATAPTPATTSTKPATTSSAKP